MRPSVPLDDVINGRPSSLLLSSCSRSKNNISLITFNRHAKTQKHYIHVDFRASEHTHVKKCIFTERQGKPSWRRDIENFPFKKLFQTPLSLLMGMDLVRTGAKVCRAAARSLRSTHRSKYEEAGGGGEDFGLRRLQHQRGCEFTSFHICICVRAMLCCLIMTHCGNLKTGNPRQDGLRSRRFEGLSVTPDTGASSTWQ